MRILVTGANGQLGNEMQVLAKENPQHTYYFTDVQELDICDKQAVWTYMAEKQIELVVNCAAYTAVDKAEDNQELAYKLNCEAPKQLASAAQANGAARYKYLLIMYLTVLRILHTRKTAILARILYTAPLNWKEKRR